MKKLIVKPDWRVMRKRFIFTPSGSNKAWERWSVAENDLILSVRFQLADHVFADLLKFVIASDIVNHIAGFGIQTDLFSDRLKQGRITF